MYKNNTNITYLLYIDFPIYLLYEYIKKKIVLFKYKKDFFSRRKYFLKRFI